jgi:hypothetical protein
MDVGFLIERRMKSGAAGGLATLVLYVVGQAEISPLDSTFVRLVESP